MVVGLLKGVVNYCARVVGRSHVYLLEYRDFTASVLIRQETVSPPPPQLLPMERVCFESFRSWGGRGAPQMSSRFPSITHGQLRLYFVGTSTRRCRHRACDGPYDAVSSGYVYPFKALLSDYPVYSVRQVNHLLRYVEVSARIHEACGELS